jgi:hypothetical protein
MQNAVFMRVIHSARHFGDEFRGLPNGDRPPLDYFIKLAAFDESHAEVALTVALADLVDGHNARMIEAGSSFGFQTKAFEVGFRGPLAKTDDF